MLQNNDSACFSSWELAQQVVAMVTGDSAGKQFYFWCCRITGNTHPRRESNHVKNFFFIQCSWPGPDNHPVPHIQTREFPCTAAALSCWPLLLQLQQGGFRYEAYLLVKQTTQITKLMWPMKEYYGQEWGKKKKIRRKFFFFIYLFFFFFFFFNFHYALQGWSWNVEYNVDKFRIDLLDYREQWIWLPQQNTSESAL